MKKHLILLLPFALVSYCCQAQINLTGDANTEASAKLEIIRIIQERIQKMTIAEINARILVSKGVTGYYKVDEIIKMEEEMYGLRSKYTTLAGNLEKNPGFTAHQGGGLSWKYMQQYNAAVTKAKAIKKQLEVVTKSGQLIQLPPLPIFNISLGGNNNAAADMQAQIAALAATYGVNTPDDWSKLDAATRQELEDKIKLLMAQQTPAQLQQGRNNINGIVGTVVNGIVPGLGTILTGMANGTSSASALVGYIVDNFQMPTDYYSSETLKLTDSERIKIIDELHMRISELHQQIMALGANMSTEARRRYGEISDTRNEQILYGPKK